VHQFVWLFSVSLIIIEKFDVSFWCLCFVHGLVLKYQMNVVETSLVPLHSFCVHCILYPGITAMFKVHFPIKLFHVFFLLYLPKVLFVFSSIISTLCTVAMRFRINTNIMLDICTEIHNPSLYNSSQNFRSCASLIIVPKAVVEFEQFIFRISEVTDSNLCHEPGYYDVNSLGFPQSPKINPGEIHHLGHVPFLLYPLRFLNLSSSLQNVRN
jgi:hypothetical protein